MSSISTSATARTRTVRPAQDPVPIVEMGRALFFDPSLSGDGAISCASCHKPHHAYADDCAVSAGIKGQLGTRNAPSLLASATASALFWDGRRSTLEALVLEPLLHPREHGLTGEDMLAEQVRRRHRSLHQAAFGLRPVSSRTIALALAAFVRTLGQKAQGTSAFDQYRATGDSSKLSHAQRRGLLTFQGRGRCASCHLIGAHDAPLTDGLYHAGEVAEALRSQLPAAAAAIAADTEFIRFAKVASIPEVAALGRYVATLRPTDVAKFRTPSLRDVALTAPYMHDGSVMSLADAVEHEIYWRTQPGETLGKLTPGDRADLVAFLESLSSNAFSPLLARAAQNAPRATYDGGDLDANSITAKFE